jgi:hypothetical protein
LPAETVVTVICRSGEASPAELVAAWLAADLRAAVTVLDAGLVEVRGSGNGLDGQVHALLDESRFLGWHVELARRESASIPAPDLDVRRA